jgi:hypothetical protein
MNNNNAAFHKGVPSKACRADWQARGLLMLKALGAVMVFR